MCCDGVQTCAGSFALLLFLPTYAAFFTVRQQFQGFQRHNIIIIIVSVIIISSSNNVCVCGAYIVDINGTNRRPASLHKRKCRVVSVSLAVGERGGEGKPAGDRVYQRQTNKRPQLQRVNATAGMGEGEKGAGCCVALRTKSL